MKELNKKIDRKFQKKDSEKELISLWRKYMKLCQADRVWHKIELEKPEKWGYRKVLILRDDVSRSDDSRFYNEILIHINNTIYSRTKVFETKDHKTRKKIPLILEPKYITHKKWNEINLTDKQRALFEKRWKNTNQYNKKQGEWVFEFTKPWMFVEKLETHYITHKTILDPQLEMDMKQTWNKIERNNLMPAISKAMGWSNKGYKDWVDIKNKFLKREDNKDLKNEGIIKGSSIRDTY